MGPGGEDQRSLSRSRVLRGDRRAAGEAVVDGSARYPERPDRQRYQEAGEGEARSERFSSHGVRDRAGVCRRADHPRPSRHALLDRPRGGDAAQVQPGIREDELQDEAAMKKFIFPRPTIRIGKCRAIVVTKKNASIDYGKPYLPSNRRPDVKYRGKIWRASRLSYRLNIALIPRLSRNTRKGMVLHTCDNCWCIEPFHLYLGTSKQNVKDMFERHPTIHEIHARTLSIGLKLRWARVRGEHV